MLSYFQSSPAYFKRFPRSVMMKNKKLVLYSWLWSKQSPIKINYLYVLTSPLKRKFQVDSNTDLNRFHLITERHFFLIRVSGKWLYMRIRIFKNCMRKAGLNLNRYQKSTDPSDLGAVCFRKIIHFWYFCSLVLDKASLALSGKSEQKYQKCNIHSDFLAAKNTVPLWIGGFKKKKT